MLCSVHESVHQWFKHGKSQTKASVSTWYKYSPQLHSISTHISLGLHFCTKGHVGHEYKRRVCWSGPGFTLEAAGFLHDVQHLLGLTLCHTSLLLKNILQCIAHCCGHLLGVPEHRKRYYIQQFTWNTRLYMVMWAKRYWCFLIKGAGLML